MIKDGGTIGVASDADAITIASNGQVTFSQTLIATGLDISGTVDFDGTTNLDVVDIDGAVDMAAGLTVVGATTITTADNTDTLSLISTDADANAGPNLRMYRNSGSPADADILGVIDFEGRNNNSQDVIYVNLLTQTADVTDGTEDGSFYIQTMVGGSLIDRVTLLPSETVLNEGSNDIDFRVESNADTHALFVEGETSNVCINVATGNSSNNGSLTIGHSGITKITGAANGNADELILIGANASANVGMSIISNNSNQGIIYFGDEDDTDIGGIIYDHGGNVLAFQTNTAERMRIDTNGKIQMGTTSTDGFLHIKNNFQSDIGMSMNDTSGSGGTAIRFKINGTTHGSIAYSGSGTAYNTSSDYRLKENVDYTFDATTRLKKLKPARFNFISDDTNTLVDGFIAHEVQSVVPEAISGDKDATETYTDDDGKEQTRPSYQGIDQAKLVPLLVKTIQELEARIKTLEDA